MSDINIEENMKIVKWVWASLNIILVIYAIILFVYAKYFRKSEVQNYKNIVEDRASHVDELNRSKRNSSKTNKVFDKIGTNNTVEGRRK